MPLSMLHPDSDPVDWRAFIDSGAAEIVLRLDREGRVEWMAGDAHEPLGLDAGAIVGHELSARIHPDDRERVLQVRSRAFSGITTASELVRVQTADGEYVEFQAAVRPVVDAEGTVDGVVMTLRDINFRVSVIRAFATLAEGSRVLLRATTEQDLLQRMCETAVRVGGYAFAWYGMPVDDEEKSVRLVARAGEDMGYLKTLRTSWGDGPLAQGPTGLSMKTQQTQVRNNIADDPGFAPWLQAASHRGIHCSIALPVLVNGGLHGSLMVYAHDQGSFDADAQELLEALTADLGYGVSRFQDAAALAESKAALAHEVEFDSLTGLAKQRLSLERIDDILQTREAPGWALLCVGVDGMTAINQAFTYAAGDAVLKEVAARLVAAAGAHDRVGRIAGDEFVVILRDLITTTDAAEAAQRILNRVNGPLQHGDVELDISACVGIAMSEGKDAQALLSDATAAMRAASRRARGSWAFLDENVAANSRLALEVQSRLRDAIPRGQIVPWFMPVVSLEDHEICGYEALVRWVLDDGTVMAPDTFLPIAERSGLILEVDRLVLNGSINALLRLPADAHIAVNVSAATLQAGALEGLVLEELNRTGLDPHRLHLEVTETALIQVTHEIRDSMQRIADLGILWWVDDFGTGYSSISHLRDLPIQGVKLDQSFTAGVSARDSHNSRLTRGLAGLAAGLDLHTIAEGVETAEQAALLQGQGWECAQGWHFGRPAPLDVWLAQPE